MKKSCMLLISALLLASNALFAGDEPKKVGDGLQVISNKSDKTVTIALGDFFPTPYTLAPGQSTWVHVSSDRQAITIYSAK